MPKSNSFIVNKLDNASASKLGQRTGIDGRRRQILSVSAAMLASAAGSTVGCAQMPAAGSAVGNPAATRADTSPGPDIGPTDRVFITNEDSNTISVIDPAKNAVDTTINLTTFDEDPRPPF